MSNEKKPDTFMTESEIKEFGAQVTVPGEVEEQRAVDAATLANAPAGFVGPTPDELEALSRKLAEDTSALCDVCGNWVRVHPSDELHHENCPRRPEVALAIFQEMADTIPSVSSVMSRESHRAAIDAAADRILAAGAVAAVGAISDDGSFTAAEVRPGDKAADIAQAAFIAGQQQHIREHVAELLEAGLPVDTAGRVIHDMVTPPRVAPPGVVDIDSLPHDQVKALARQAGANKDSLLAKVLALRAAALSCRENGWTAQSGDYQQMYIAERELLPAEQRWW